MWSARHLLWDGGGDTGYTEGKTEQQKDINHHLNQQLYLIMKQLTLNVTNSLVVEDVFTR